MQSSVSLYRSCNRNGVTTPNVKNRTVRPVAQTCRHWKGNRNRILQPRNDGFRLGNAASHKRSFAQDHIGSINEIS